jgi:hypothetical protein
VSLASPVCLCRLRDVHERAHYLRLLPTKNLKAIFKVAPDADVLSTILAALVVVANGSGDWGGGGGGGDAGDGTVGQRPPPPPPGNSKPKPKRAVTYLRKIAASLRFGMAVMLFSRADRAAVRSILQAADLAETAAAATATAATTASPGERKSLDQLRAQYGATGSE